MRRRFGIERGGQRFAKRDRQRIFKPGVTVMRSMNLLRVLFILSAEDDRALRLRPFRRVTLVFAFLRGVSRLAESSVGIAVDFARRFAPAAGAWRVRFPKRRPSAAAKERSGRAATSAARAARWHRAVRGAEASGVLLGELFGFLLERRSCALRHWLPPASASRKCGFQRFDFARERGQRFDRGGQLRGGLMAMCQAACLPRAVWQWRLRRRP